MNDPARTTTCRPRTRSKSPFIPLLLLATALLLWFGFQSYQLWGERQQLATLRASQDPQVEAAGKVRASLDAVATATAQLADSGNANARMHRRGIAQARHHDQSRGGQVGRRGSPPRRDHDAGQHQHERRAVIQLRRLAHQQRRQQGCKQR